MRKRATTTWHALPKLHNAVSPELKAKCDHWIAEKRKFLQLILFQLKEPISTHCEDISSQAASNRDARASSARSTRAHFRRSSLLRHAARNERRQAQFVRSGADSIGNHAAARSMRSTEPQHYSCAKARASTAEQRRRRRRRR
jgi:hypothetical protein